jgi:hypothetical protein
LSLARKLEAKSLLEVLPEVAARPQFACEVDYQIIFCPSRHVALIFFSFYLTRLGTPGAIVFFYILVYIFFSSSYLFFIFFFPCYSTPSHPG